jgi:hypothetical protein
LSPKGSFLKKSGRLDTVRTFSQRGCRLGERLVAAAG